MQLKQKITGISIYQASKNPKTLEIKPIYGVSVDPTPLLNSSAFKYLRQELYNDKVT